MLLGATEHEGNFLGFGGGFQLLRIGEKMGFQKGKEPEVGVVVALMGCSGEEKVVGCPCGQRLAQDEAARLLFLGAGARYGELVGFVHDHQVPPAIGQKLPVPFLFGGVHRHDDEGISIEERIR